MSEKRDIPFFNETDRQMLQEIKALCKKQKGRWIITSREYEGRVKKNLSVKDVLTIEEAMRKEKLNPSRTRDILRSAVKEHS